MLARGTRVYDVMVYDTHSLLESVIQFTVYITEQPLMLLMLIFRLLMKFIYFHLTIIDSCASC